MMTCVMVLVSDVDRSGPGHGLDMGRGGVLRRVGCTCGGAGRCLSTEARTPSSAWTQISPSAHQEVGKNIPEGAISRAGKL